MWKGHHASQIIIDEAGELLTISDPIELTDADPTQPGWYATLECWDVREGLFPGAHYWTGSEWQCSRRASIQHWPITFETEAAAEAYAYEHDPER